MSNEREKAVRNEREKAVLHLLFLDGLVVIALMYGQINQEEAALHHAAITRDIIRVCYGELTIDDVRQEVFGV